MQSKNHHISPAGFDGRFQERPAPRGSMYNSIGDRMSTDYGHGDGTLLSFADGIPSVSPPGEMVGQKIMHNRRTFYFLQHNNVR